ncbi:serine/threonine-protein kinase pim-1-like [Acanthochromis polyacanthus]|uniref:serine/threonine-protein kinase pim-1-like n=1 Tax=Acanthochromis polyacanthus TaxID=80966 RepID=UPI002234CE3E|nr:serine/threonine-protein kinase pim-1-like [Acanthochromis polyacanthus]
MEDKRQRSRTKSPSRKTSSDKLSAKPQKRRRLDGFQDEESPCTSTDTGRVFFFEGDQPKRRRTTVSHDDQNKSKWETSRDREEPSAKKRRPLDVFLVDGESPSTSADTDADEPGRKKRRYFSDLEVTNEDTGDDSALIAAFEAQYVQQNPLGEGGCGSVYAGYRKADLLPVAIKYVPKDKIFCKHRDKNGKLISVEVAIMKRLGGGSAGSAGKSAPVALLDFYDLQQQLILVLERPVPAQDLLQYIMENGGCLEEEEAKIITKQLVDAAIHLLENRIFHRDIKVENILIETGSDVPRVRLIDFGLSCVFNRGSSYNVFYGTIDRNSPLSGTTPIHTPRAQRRCGKWEWFCMKWFTSMRTLRPADSS